MILLIKLDWSLVFLYAGTVDAWFLAERYPIRGVFMCALEYLSTTILLQEIREKAILITEVIMFLGILEA